MRGWSVRPDARSESVGQLVLKLQQALRDGDQLALERRTYRLNYAIRIYDPLCRKLGCRDAAALSEARQRILLRLYTAVQRHLDEPIERADAFARNAAEWELRDYLRERRRPTARLDAGAGALPPELQESGVHAGEELLAKIEAERHLEETRQKFRAFFAHYTELAGAEGRGRLGSQHLVAWFALRVQGRTADQVAEMLEITHLAEGGRSAVWQWARRGSQLVLRLAEQDPDRARARVMRAAVLGERAPDSSGNRGPDSRRVGS